MELFLAEQEPTVEQIKAGLRRRARWPGQLVPVLCGSALKNKGVAEAARRHRGLPAFAPGPTRHRGRGPRRGGARDPAPGRRRAVQRPGLQDPGRSLRGQAGLPEGVQRNAGGGQDGAERQHGQAGTDPARCCRMHADKREDLHRDPHRRHRGRRGLQGDPHRGHAGGAGTPAAAGQGRRSPSRSSTWPSSRGRRPTRTSWAMPCSPCPTRIPPSMCGSDPDSGQTVIWGMGELHLEIMIDRLQREHNVACTRRPPAGGVPRDGHARGRAEGPVRTRPGRQVEFRRGRADDRARATTAPGSSS